MEQNVSDQPKQEDEDGKPECSDTRKKLLKVLRILNLTHKYPGRLTRDDMYQITKCSLFDELPKCQDELARYFIHKITRNDSTAREFCIFSTNKNSPTFQTPPKSKYRTNMKKREEEKRKLDVSPMDIIIAVFLCCDNICRQDLVSHMWSCRLAIPLVIQEKAPPTLPSCFLWPLRNIVMKWKTQHDGNDCEKEGRLVNEPFSSVAFIRVGESRLSKSILINEVISAPGMTHSIFFHRNSPSSTRHRYLVDGLIDISWYFPTPKTKEGKTNHFKDAIMFLNLHGDAYKFQCQIPVLSNLANIITVLCKVDDLERCRSMIQSYLNMGNTVLVILTDQQIQGDAECAIDNFNETLKATENQLYYLELVDKQRAELVEETRNLLMSLVEGKFVCLDKACSRNKNVTVDENSDILLNTKKKALAISSLIQSKQYNERKSSFLYLQGDPWINWAAADKEKLRISYRKKDEDVQEYLTEREQTMKKCRSQQKEFLTKGSTHQLAEFFLDSVSVLNSEERQLFLRWLKFETDDLSRNDLSPVYEEYQKTMQQLTAAEKIEKDKLNVRLEYLDNQIALRTFGLEHIMREIGQIYEALHLDEPQHPLLKHNLPQIAANILLDGYPFELFDGCVNAVPIEWITDVLKHLDNIIRKNKPAVRMKVISALGIQSSGKSTMLNALFGCQYAVSAGRCTRGIYCQLIKVEETYSNELGMDYILTIDTEGLQAQELSASGQMVKHDNELSTFVIGLADLTILNLMGESTTYLNDLLPILVHAFLRMEMATKLRPKCIIVHQNVIKEDERKLLHQRRILEDTLNRMTKMACNVERMEIKSFKDIIEFDVSKDVWYLSEILVGSKPMAPISTRYSDELNILRQTLVKKETDGESITLDFFITRLQDLWEAIKRDDFVYQFRNTLEAEARRKLDEYWCEANWKFRQPVRAILQQGHIEIENTQNVNELESVVRTLENNIREEIANECTRQKVAFSIFIRDADVTTKDIMKQWSVDMDKRFNDLGTELLGDMKDTLREFDQCKRNKFSLNDGKSKYKDTLKESIAQLVQSVKLNKSCSLSKDDILKLFDTNWKGWKSIILKDSPICQTYINIETDAFEALCRRFPLGKDKLQKYIRDRPLSDYGRHDLEIEVLVSKFPSLKSTTNKDIEEVTKSLFCKVETRLKLRERYKQPYSKEDIEDIVQNVNDHFLENMKYIELKPKHEVYLAVTVCGHAIKRLKKIHDDYLKQTHIENLLEEEKMHYFRIFSTLCNEEEEVGHILAEYQEILRNGVLHKMMHSLPDELAKDLRNKVLTMKSKTMAIYDHMINMAREQLYENFKVFIEDPYQSITRYICTRILQYAERKEKPLETCFNIIINKLQEDVERALKASYNDEGTDFKIWLKNFRNETKALIVLENIDKLHDLGKDRAFDLNLFFKRVEESWKRIIQNIKLEMRCFLDKNYTSIIDEVVPIIRKNIIGCTEKCPFCGAICLNSQVDHDEEHFTTLHRPQGCNGRNYSATNVLVTDTCPECITNEDQFMYFDKKVPKWCPYKDYKTVFPKWKITTDSTGDETSYWNFFFAKYAQQIAGKDLKVPQIPKSWKELNCEAEIRKLEKKMKM